MKKFNESKKYLIRWELNKFCHHDFCLALKLKELSSIWSVTTCENSEILKFTYFQCHSSLQFWWHAKNRHRKIWSGFKVSFYHNWFFVSTFACSPFRFEIRQKIVGEKVVKFLMYYPLYWLKSCLIRIFLKRYLPLEF